MSSLPTDAETRKNLPLWDFMFGYFPDAWIEVAKCAVTGNTQHALGPENKLRWVRDVSADHLNKTFRHQFDYGTGATKDIDGRYHLAKAAWRLLAQLQLDIEKERGEREMQPCLRGNGDCHAGCCK